MPVESTFRYQAYELGLEQLRHTRIFLQKRQGPAGGCGRVARSTAVMDAYHKIIPHRGFIQRIKMPFAVKRVRPHGQDNLNIPRMATDAIDFPGCQNRILPWNHQRGTQTGFPIQKGIHLPVVNGSGKRERKVFVVDAGGPVVACQNAEFGIPGIKGLFPQKVELRTRRACLRLRTGTGPQGGPRRIVVGIRGDIGGFIDIVTPEIREIRI